jgi:integrase
MKTQALSSIPALPVSVAQPEAVKPEVREFIRAEKSDNTRRAYKADCQVLVDWCKERNYRPFPLATGQLAEFLASQASTAGVKAQTLVRRVAAIRHAHRVLELPDPFDQAARSTLAGIRNKLGVAVDSKTPLLAADLLKIILAIPTGQLARAADYRDSALLLLGFAGAMRRSELVALDVSDLQFCAEGLRVTIRHSKTDQAGATQQIAVPFGSRPETCPVTAVKRWLEYRNIETGPVFRRLDNNGRTVRADRLEDGSVAIILKKRAEAAGLDGARLSAHSLRSGFLTSCAENGASLWAMMDVSRHKSVQTVRSYVRSAQAFERYAGKGLL